MADCVLKLVLVGDGGCGKTNLLSCFANCMSVHSFTCGRDNFEICSMEFDGVAVKLHIWDYGSADCCKTDVLNFSGASGVLVCYDTTCKQSFDKCEDWLQHVKKFAAHNVDVALIGTKTDLQDQREVTLQAAQTFAGARGLAFFETSAKDNVNVSDAFCSLVERMLRRSDLPEYVSAKAERLSFLTEDTLDDFPSESGSCYSGRSTSRPDNRLCPRIGLLKCRAHKIER